MGDMLKGDVGIHQVKVGMRKFAEIHAGGFTCLDVCGDSRLTILLL